ncbi:MAG: DUF4296 domain-containing protein [Paludibacteraceae bacterium]|nr:DUF4296 domain-containing protein [Paludibacteraceae bacterium]
MKHKILILIAFFSASIAMSSCKPDVGKPELSKDKMVRLLIDVHLAQAYASRSSMTNTSEIDHNQLYRSVLDKHGVTEAQFDSSVAWYARNANDYKAIYNIVKDSLKRRQLKL